MTTNAINLMTAIIRTDSYKLSQWLQYPPDTAFISSYIESRGGAYESVFFGLQAFIKQYLLTPITQLDIETAEKIVVAHGLPFNRAGWEIIVNEYEGYLPIQIEAVPEGTVMPTHNVQVQMVNTDPRLFWLTSYLETAILRAIWYPSTVATKSRQFKQMIKRSLEETSDIPVEHTLPFKLHDFGARGASSAETATLGGMAHLVNFMGTDTFEAVVGVMEYYNTDQVVGFSIPASEHSTVTSWGRAHEVDAFANMIDKFGGPGKLYACVSDSYNIWDAVHLWGNVLKDNIIKKGGTLIVRPDSGDPTVIPIHVIHQLMQKFGYTVNSKGYRVLPDCVRVIQGDGLNETTLPKLLENLIHAKISVDNIAFGMGGGLLQAWNRDTLKYAMKASARMDLNEVWTDVYKDPITDKVKKSKRGRFALINTDDGIKTIAKNQLGSQQNLLRTVFVDGMLLIDDTFEAIRERAKLEDDRE